MRVWQIEGPGLDRLSLLDRPEPEPGDRDVVLSMKAASLNYRDWMIASGSYRIPPRYPLVPLSDGCGEVVAIGRKVTRWRPGDRVVSSFFSGWIDGEQTVERSATALGGAADGVLAERVVLPEHGVVRAPEHMSDLEAATLPCAALTAWHALFEGIDPLRPGQSVLLEGTGGVSIFGLQLAKIAGGRAIVTSSSDDKLVRAKALGADDTINYVREPEWQDRVRELTQGRGVDHVLEVGGKDTIAKGLASLRHGGQMHLIGGVSGVAAELPLGAMASAGARVRRLFVGSVAMLEAMNRALSWHRVRPVVDRVFSFEDARAAIEDLKRGTHFGKVCVAFGDQGPPRP